MMGTPGTKHFLPDTLSSVLGEGPHNEIEFLISPDHCHPTADNLCQNQSSTPECEISSSPIYFVIDSPFFKVEQILQNGFIPDPLLYSSSLSSGPSRPCTAEYEENVGSHNGEFQSGLILLNSGKPLSTISPLISGEKDAFSSSSVFCETPHVPLSNSSNETCLFPDQFARINVPTSEQNSVIQDYSNPESASLHFPDLYSPHFFGSQQVASVNSPLINTSLPESTSWYNEIYPYTKPQLERVLPSSEPFTSRCVQPNLILCERLRPSRSNETLKGGRETDFEKKATFREDLKISNMTDRLSRLAFEDYADYKCSFTERRGNKIRNGITNSDTGTRLRAERRSLLTRQPARIGPFANKAESRPFVCEFILPNMKKKCGSRFQRSEHLKRHSATHKNEKNHQCHICGNLFGRTDNLQQHIKTHSNINGRNSKLLRAKEEMLKAGKKF
ncbi:expressed protein [Phakopsora pachyrhizi]|uniref:Expressed protein n=1 Tax=Phakopsora pachyrhizi TaxID=170000 RepID=A0AAV0AJI0_PHAPC|nr:expressed protein [Phakopsora pachyrhizi]